MDRYTDEQHRRPVGAPLPPFTFKLSHDRDGEAQRARMRARARAQCWELDALPRKLAIKWAISSRLEYKLDPAAAATPGVLTDCRLFILYNFLYALELY